MAFEVDDVEYAGALPPGVSGAVVQALVSLIRSEAGEAGVAQALALAAEDRSFAALGDTDRWTSLDDAVALFAGAALVTGDGAVALHTGEELLWTGEGTELADRVRVTLLHEVGHHFGLGEARLRELGWA